MIAYVLSRVVQTLPVLFLVTVAVFLVVRLVPGDPAELSAGENAPPGRVEEIRRDLGIDKPIAEQYIDWLSRAVRGDLGMSFEKGLPVRRLLAIAIPPTIELAVIAYPLALLIGVPLGAVAGMNPRSRIDALASAWSVVAIATPGFVLASLLLWIFAVELQWLPASGRVSLFTNPIGGLRAATLPAFALAVGLSAVLTRYTRTAISQVYLQDYVRTARAKGLSEEIVLRRHALKNALIPIITIAALQLGQLLSGAVIVEQVFTRPGMGRLMVGAVQSRDYAVVQGGLLVLVGGYVFVNLLADLAYGFIDPRTKYR